MPNPNETPNLGTSSYGMFYEEEYPNFYTNLVGHDIDLEDYIHAIGEWQKLHNIEPEQ